VSEPVLIAVIVAMPPTLTGLVGLIVSLVNRKKIDVLHLQINNRMSELLTLAHSQGHSEGVASEIERVREKGEE